MVIGLRFTPELVTALGECDWNARAAISRLEGKALAASPEVTLAQAELIASARCVRDLRVDCERSVRDSSEWREAQRVLASAQNAVARGRSDVGSSSATSA